ncbi:MAG TPA: cysteine hydrolase family protein [Aggregatilinea sp.]|uniref:cysteine hydrolase family protein n=1 Tax=Aggregatilinea sp. TaxID=2806333 RepID=UPI002BC7922E|nr:cysteine hydrolase family protein [Aggregatilinea sp.]HML24800.1 cysteine hydrolase family protein [Aggregatilinea sp.]
MNTALLLVDIQNDYFPGGKMALVGSETAGEVAGRLLAFFRAHDLPLVHIQHIGIRPSATFFLPGTEGAEIHASVKPLEGEMVIEKHWPNSFRETPLLDHLHGLGIERLVIAGMMTHMCVDAATRAAVDYGFECWVAQDACATRNMALGDQTVAAHDVHIAFLAALNSAYGKVMPAEMIMKTLEEALPAAAG